MKQDCLTNESHRRYYRIAGITIQVETDLPIKDDTFHPKFKPFEVDDPGEDVVLIRHHFSFPDSDSWSLGKAFYERAPWAIYRENGSWVYLGILPKWAGKRLHKVAVFNTDHSRGRIYSNGEDVFLKGGLHSLTLFPTDQILLARVLADRQGCYLHSCGVNFNGKGLLFAGHSEAGKTTMATMLKDKAEILCDDRIIVRRKSEGFKIYGTWSHGDVPDISANSVPLHAILFLKKADRNKLLPLKNKKEIAIRLLACVIKPLITVDWWQRTLALVDGIVGEIPCYEFEFDKKGGVENILKQL